MSDTPRQTVEVSRLLEELAREIAVRVVDHLRATDVPGYLDQSTSPLGRRRHIAAVRSGRLPGIRIGRRYLARSEDVDAYVARAPATRDSSRILHPVDDLAAELGFTGRRKAG